MSPRSRTRPVDDTDATPAQRVAAEVRAACAALERALAAGKGVRDDVKLELAVDDLAVTLADLELLDRELRGETR